MEINIDLNLGKKKLHMLAIGKNIPYLKMIKSFFEKANYSVVTANSFRRAHGILKNQGIDCVLLDVSGAYGEVLRFVKNCRNNKNMEKIKAGIAIMFILEYEDKRFIHKALEAGADDYVCNNQDFSIVKLRLDLLLERNFYRNKLVDLKKTLEIKAN
ncbi:MAG: response regulator [Oligoflexales bacterium]|nr:response regulator [Oligoflexales bacterium]